VGLSEFDSPPLKGGDTMRHYLQDLKKAIRNGDMVLLLLLLITTTYGCIMIASAKNYVGSTRFVIIQIVAALLGVMMYFLVSSVDVTVLSEHRIPLAAFNCFLILLLIPFGVDYDSGNKSWIDIPLLPVDIQPAEICKITFILIMASAMASNQSRISSWRSILQMGFHLGLLVGLNMIISRDLGVSLIFVFIFIGMAFAGGVSLLWFLLAGGTVAFAWPFLWDMMDPHQRNRIQVLFDPTVDPDGVTVRYHAVRSMRSLTGGGWAGQGLFNGIRTQNGELPAQHTDFIFSAIGEELGFIGCMLVLLLEFLIIARCIYVGNRSQDYARRLVCYGAASALIFQVCVNVGMCIGVAPVIGLTLPFMSYGGSSLMTLYAMLGLVSGVHARPEAPSHELYIRAPR
jgi:rod shape determining protein RodA